MDRLDEQLRNDAAAISADVSVEDKQRLEAMLAATPQVPATRRPATGLRWAALAAGLGSFALVILLQDATPPVVEAPVAATPVYESVPPALLTVPLRVEPADLTEPLQQELNALRADVAKARESIERDLRVTF